MIRANGVDRNVRYTAVHNLTGKYAGEDSGPAPDAVVCFGGSDIPAKWAEYRRIGGRASVFGDIVIFSAAGALPNRGMIEPAAK